MKGLIIGGGIGGLTAGIALLQKGVDVTIYEQAPELREAGAGIWVATNALQVYDRLGVATKIIEAGNVLDKVEIKTAKGSRISSLPMVEIRQKYGFGTVAIHRADLQRILAAQLPKNKIVTGRRLRKYSQTADKITAEMDDGSFVEADFIIGADGIKSQTRRQVNAAVNWRYSGQTCWRFVVDYPLDEPKAMYEIWGKQAGLRAAYSHINDRQVYTYITLATDRNGIDDVEYLQDTLLVTCVQMPPIIKELISAADQRKILRNDLSDFEPITKWHDGRCVLIGDAVHPTTPNLGQGACQAIESAYVLADCIAKQPDKLAAAFQQYQKIRQAKAHYITNTSWKFGQMTNKTGFSKWMVEMGMRLTPKFALRKQLDKVYKLNF